MVATSRPDRARRDRAPYLPPELLLARRAREAAFDFREAAGRMARHLQGTGLWLQRRQPRARVTSKAYGPDARLASGDFVVDWASQDTPPREGTGPAALLESVLELKDPGGARRRRDLWRAAAAGVLAGIALPWVLWGTCWLALEAVDLVVGR